MDGSFFDGSTNRAQVLSECQVSARLSRRKVLVEAGLTPEAGAELHSRRLGAFRVTDVGCQKSSAVTMCWPQAAEDRASESCGSRRCGPAGNAPMLNIGSRMMWRVCPARHLTPDPWQAGGGRHCWDPSGTLIRVCWPAATSDRFGPWKANTSSWHTVRVRPDLRTVPTASM